MLFRSVPATEWETIRRVDGNAKKIRQRAALLIGTLASQYSDGAPEENHGVKFSAINDKSILGAIESDVGDGRFTLSFAFANKELVGNLQIERKITGFANEAGWEPIWGVTVPAQGEIFVGMNPDRFAIPSGNAGFGEERAHAVYEFGQVILYSLVFGPLKA